VTEVDLVLPSEDPGLVVSSDDFLLEYHPETSTQIAVVVSVPHYGIGSPRQYTTDEFTTTLGHHLAYGFADDYAAELYGHLHLSGASVVATQLSRLFVDVNRPRDDFAVEDGLVYSKTGVVRTHSRRDMPIFAEPTDHAEAEFRLRQFYDPYYASLGYWLAQRIEQHGHCVLLDAHTANARRMGDHQVVLGTSRGRTASADLVDVVRSVFVDHGFDVEVNVPGYGGANIVRSFGAHERPATEALQIEINAGLLQTLDNDAFINSQIDGRRPPPDMSMLSRLRACIADVVSACGKYVANGRTRSPLA
jgi:N-formylglutamate amidohydrolase